jgi:hypothetical protein
MLLIPIHTLLDDKPGKLPQFFNEKNLGVCSKTIRNIINENHSASESSIKNIVENASTFFVKVDGISFDKDVFADSLIESEANLNSPMSLWFNDKYFQYWIKIVDELMLLDIGFRNAVEEIKKAPNQNQEKMFIDFFYGYDYPGNMLNDNWDDRSDISFTKTIQRLNRIRIDTLFYLAAAYDVNFNYSFAKTQNGGKPFFSCYLPVDNNGKTKPPIGIWIEAIIEKNNFKSIAEFGRLLYSASQKNDGDAEGIGPDSVIRQVREWKSGRRYPKWGKVDQICEVIAQKHNLKNDDLGAVKEEGKRTFAFAKGLQKILGLMLENPEQKLGFNRAGVFDYFNRYLFWHNYHSLNFGRKSNQGHNVAPQP